MMKRSLLCTILLGLLGCSPFAPTTTPSPTISVLPPISVKSNGGLHLVIAVQGQLRVKRVRRSEFAPALFGTPLRYGDLLRLGPQSQATVICADLTLVTVRSGFSGVPCRSVARSVLVYGGSLVSPTRGDMSGLIPIVLSPRRTKLLTTRPTLRWTPMAGVTTYTVSVRGPNVNWSADVSSRTEVVYPDDAPVLAPGATYKLIVVGGGRSSDEEGEAGLGFTLLKPHEVQAVREQESRIRELGLAKAPTQFLIALLYGSIGLNAEAIEELRDLSEILKQPAVVRLLADLYRDIGLNRQAEEAYLQALDLSQREDDVEGEALAQNALGLIYEALGNKGEAVRRLKMAMELYQKLGDARMVLEIRDILGVLSQPQ